MGKTTLLKSLLLLCALIAGSNSLWATDILNETFNISGTAAVASSYNDWTIARCWGGDGSIRIGASSGDKGSIITPALSGLTGSAVLTYEVKRYDSDTGTISLSVESSDADLFGDISVASSTISTESWTEKTVRISNGCASTKIKFEMSSKRMYLRNVRIVPAVFNAISHINFEVSNLNEYTEWSFDKIALRTSSITAHGGSYYGINGNTSDASTGTTSGSITTQTKISNPGTISFFVSRESTNSTSSSWYVEVSSDGSSWTQVGVAQSATSMAKGSWTEVSRNLTSYHNVYVRIRYDGSTAIRAIDDIVLTEGKFVIAEACTDGNAVYSTYSSTLPFIVPSDLIVSEIKLVDGKLQMADYSTGDVVPANTGVLITSLTSGEIYVEFSDEEGTSILGANNILRASGDEGITAAAMATAAPSCKYYRLTMHNGTDLGFWWGAASGAAFDLAANKAYLAIPITNAREGFAFDNEATGIAEMKAKRNVENEKFYILTGQRVNANHKGLVIVNGKKYLNK